MKSKYFILYKHGMENQIKWPEGWGNTCRANIASMLQEVLKVKSVGSEIKLIWNYQHEKVIRDKYDVTDKQLQDYLKADSGSLHFHSAGTRKRAVKILEEMGANDLVLVENYRDVLTYQAHFYNHKEFPKNIGFDTNKDKIQYHILAFECWGFIIEIDKGFPNIDQIIQNNVSSWPKWEYRWKNWRKDYDRAFCSYLAKKVFFLGCATNFNIDRIIYLMSLDKSFFPIDGSYGVKLIQVDGFEFDSLAELTIKDVTNVTVEP